MRRTCIPMEQTSVEKNVSASLSEFLTAYFDCLSLQFNINNCPLVSLVIENIADPIPGLRVQRQIKLRERELWRQFYLTFGAVKNWGLQRKWQSSSEVLHQLLIIFFHFFIYSDTRKCSSKLIEKYILFHIFIHIVTPLI